MLTPLREKIIQILLEKKMEKSKIAITISYLTTEDLQKEMLQIIQNNPQMSNYLLMRKAQEIAKNN